jgi:hypothetical protein
MVRYYFYLRHRLFHHLVLSLLQPRLDSIGLRLEYARSEQAAGGGEGLATRRPSSAPESTADRVNDGHIQRALRPLGGGDRHRGGGDGDGLSLGSKCETLPAFGFHITFRRDDFEILLYATSFMVVPGGLNILSCSKVNGSKSCPLTLSVAPPKTLPQVLSGSRFDYDWR